MKKSGNANADNQVAKGSTQRANGFRRLRALRGSESRSSDVPRRREGSTVRISALVSRTTQELLERYSRSTGTKKSYLIEQALLHNLQDLNQIPLDFVMHIDTARSRARRILEEHERMVLRDADRDAFLQAVSKPPRPAKRLVAALRRHKKLVAK